MRIQKLSKYKKISIKGKPGSTEYYPAKNKVAIRQRIAQIKKSGRKPITKTVHLEKGTNKEKRTLFGFSF